MYTAPHQLRPVNKNVHIGARKPASRVQAVMERPLPVYSAFKVLDAKGMSGDFYRQCLSYGQSMIATMLDTKVLVFSPEDLSRFGQLAVTQDWTSPAAGELSSAWRIPTAVCVSSISDTLVGVGDSTGGFATCVFREGSSTLELLHHHDSGGGSVNALSATSFQPNIFVSGADDGRVRIYDTRAAGFLVGAAAIGLQEAFPGASKRIVSLDINCSGGLVAVGTNHGAVQVLALDGSLSTPVSEWTTPAFGAARALAFHPRTPCELVVGGGVGDGALRTYDVYTNRLLDTVATGVQVCQAAYSAEGRFLVTTHGFADGAAMPDRDVLDTVARTLDSPVDMGPAARSGFPAPSSTTLENAVCMWARADSQGSELARYADKEASPLTRAAQTRPKQRAEEAAPQHSLWRREVALHQHSSRPLHLSRCRAAANAGVFATAAGGDDSSIRLWRMLSAPGHEQNIENSMGDCLR